MKKIPAIIPLAIIPIFIVAISILIDTCQISPYMLFICTAIIYSLFLFVYGLTNKIWISWLGVSCPVFLLVLINYYKLMLSGAPFLPSDFSFISGFDKILNFALPQLEFNIIVFLSITAYIAFTIFLIFIEKHLLKKKKTQLLSIVFGLTIALIMLFPHSHNFIGNLGCENTDSSETLVLKHGVIAGLYSAVTDVDVSTPTALAKERIYKSVNKHKTLDQKVEDPTVIFLMSESFFDVDKLENVSFSEDPIKNFHKLKKQFSSGEFVSNTYRGGTGFVEFEFLTGMCGYFLNSSDTLDSLPAETYSRIPAISDIFKKNGYSTKFLHSYNDSLYNRRTIYNGFKFDELIFAEDFKTKPEYSGGYISDKSLANEIISTYESTTDKPLMLYAISMENHQPYTEGKYGNTSEIKATSDMLSKSEEKVLEAYLQGLSNADKALGQLIEYFSNVNKPVMIVFWGDHLPSLDLEGDHDVLEKILYSPAGKSYEWEARDLLKVLTTDYVVWDNFGLKKTDKAIGSTMFGVEMSDRLGLEMPDYFKWLSVSLKDDFIVYRSRIFAANDEVSDTVPRKYQDMIDEYSMIVRDIAYGENYIFGTPQR